MAGMYDQTTVEDNCQMGDKVIFPSRLVLIPVPASLLLPHPPAGVELSAEKGIGAAAGDAPDGDQDPAELCLHHWLFGAAGVSKLMGLQLACQPMLIWGILKLVTMHWDRGRLSIKVGSLLCFCALYDNLCFQQ